MQRGIINIRLRFGTNHWPVWGHSPVSDRIAPSWRLHLSLHQHKFGVKNVVYMNKIEIFSVHRPVKRQEKSKWLLLLLFLCWLPRYVTRQIGNLAFLLPRLVSKIKLPSNWDPPPFYVAGWKARFGQNIS